jgi:hypothetical protein
MSAAQAIGLVVVLVVLLLAWFGQELAVTSQRDERREPHG